MDYSIKNTTKEQRMDFVKSSLGIVLADGKMPDKETQELLFQYINGKKELAEIKNEIIERYKK